MNKLKRASCFVLGILIWLFGVVAFLVWSICRLCYALLPFGEIIALLAAACYMYDGSYARSANLIGLVILARLFKFDEKIEELKNGKQLSKGMRAVEKIFDCAEKFGGWSLNEYYQKEK